MKPMIINYAPMPVTTTKFEVMVQIVSPIALIPKIIKVKTLADVPCLEDYIKYTMLEDFHEILTEGIYDSDEVEDQALLGNYITECYPVISGAKLVRCELLVPKSLLGVTNVPTNA